MSISRMGAMIEFDDEEWALLEDLFDPAGRRGAPARYDRRGMVAAILFLARERRLGPRDSAHRPPGARPRRAQECRADDGDDRRADGARRSDGSDVPQRRRAAAAGRSVPSAASSPSTSTSCRSSGM
jgi:hypothetical protein